MIAEVRRLHSPCVEQALKAWVDPFAYNSRAHTRLFLSSTSPASHGNFEHHRFERPTLAIQQTEYRQTMAARRSAFVVSAVPQVCEPQPESTCPLLPPPPVRIGYEVVGRGPVHVLFVSGMCVSRRMWDAQVQELSKYPETYSLCLLDNRGTGDSDIPAAGWLDSRNANYSIETLARDAWTVADDVFGPTSSIHVIGWSMGSMIAQRYVEQSSVA